MTILSKRRGWRKSIKTWQLVDVNVVFNVVWLLTILMKNILILDKKINFSITHSLLPLLISLYFLVYGLIVAANIFVMVVTEEDVVYIRSIKSIKIIILLRKHQIDRYHLYHLYHPYIIYIIFSIYFFYFIF